MDNLTTRIENFLANEHSDYPVNILLVDDKPENLYSLKKLLQLEGKNINFILCTSGEEALKIAIKGNIALIMLDVQMPEMDGYEVARILKASLRTENIPIIFVTANDREIDNVVEGFNVGAVDFLFKPLNAGITRAKVKAFIKLFQRNEMLNSVKQELLSINEGLKEDVNRKTKELAQSDNKFQAIFQNAASGIAIINPQGCCIDCNAKFEHITGYEKGELYLKSLKDITFADDISTETRAFETLNLKRSSEYIFEKRYVHKNGELIYVNAAISSVWNDKTLEYFIAVVEDITEKKVAEQKLKENEEFLKKIIESSSDCIIVLDLDGNLLSFNEGGQKLLEIDNAQQFDKQCWLDLFSGNNTQDANHQIEVAKKGGMGRFSGAFSTLKSNSQKWCDVIITPILGQGGFPEKLLSVSRDITQQKMLELEQQKYVSLVQNSRDFIAITDLEGRVIFINNAGLNLIGLKDFEEAKGTYIKDYVFTEDQAKLGLDGQIGEIRYRHFVTDEAIPVYCNSVVINDPVSGAPIAVATVTHDLREGKRREAELAKINATLEAKNRQLKRLNNDLDDFIYSVSHDLKAPINNVESLINTLIESLPEGTRVGEEVTMLENMIKDSIERFKNTIKELTEIARTQNQDVLDFEEVALGEIYNEVRLVVNDQIIESGASMVADFSHAETILFSRKNIRSIFYNLISNAIKYRSPARKPTVSITSVITEDGEIRLDVADNGLGIKEEDYSNVFKMFKRLHTHVEGTGVGMHLVKRIVDNADGRVEINSVEGLGTTFSVFLRNQSTYVTEG